MHILTLAEIDRELADRARETDAITATLLELDQHPGLTLLRNFPPTGVTEQRWRPARAAFDAMWEDLERLRSLLDRARATRARRRLDGIDREQLTDLLRGRPLEVARIAIPLSQRSLTGPAERVEHVGFADTVERMRAAFATIAEILDTVQAVNHRVMSRIAPLQTELDRVGTTAPELRVIADGITALSQRAVTDPLALTAEEINRRTTELTEQLRHAAELIAELDAIAADWDNAVARAREQLDALRAAHRQAAHARTEVQRTILANQLPTHNDESGPLRKELDALAANPPVPERLRDLRGRILAAIETATNDAELAQGLLDRYAELRGRLSAYRVKADRLGVAEDRDVSASAQIAAGLLSRRPCDLAAVTRAVADYQQLIGEKSGRTL